MKDNWESLLCETLRERQLLETLRERSGQVGIGHGFISIISLISPLVSQIQDAGKNNRR